MFTGGRKIPPHTLFRSLFGVLIFYSLPVIFYYRLVLYLFNMNLPNPKIPENKPEPVRVALLSPNGVELVEITGKDYLSQHEFLCNNPCCGNKINFFGTCSPECFHALNKVNIARARRSCTGWSLDSCEPECL